MNEEVVSEVEPSSSLCSRHNVTQQAHLCSDTRTDRRRSEACEARAFSPATDEHPLVTFALFAFNQEKYIREAVEGAFSQTYNPMEIILSDDGSTDRTFEIMEKMARNYTGPKTVAARRTRRNMGTFLHLLDVARIAKGKLIILAAGDDVSKNERASEIVSAWTSSQAWGFYSKFDRINETGTVVSASEDPRALFALSYRLRHYFRNSKGMEIIHGATSAYDKRLFDHLDVTESDYILSEDGALSVLLHLLGKQVRMIDSSLVRYRQNEQSLTNGSTDRIVTLQVIQNDEVKIERFARSQANRCELFIRWHDNVADAKQELNIEEIISDLRKHRVRAAWSGKPLSEKLAYLKDNLNYDDIKWALPRLLPKSLFFRIKALVRKF